MCGPANLNGCETCGEGQFQEYRENGKPAGMECHNCGELMEYSDSYIESLDLEEKVKS